MPVIAPSGKRRIYYDRDKAEALAVLQANRGSPKTASQLTGFPESTIRLWANSERDMTAEDRAAPADVRLEAKKDMAQTLERTSWRYLDRLEQADLSAERPYYLSQTFKILREQHQLLTGGATSRVELSLASFLGSVGTPVAALVSGEAPAEPANLGESTYQEAIKAIEMPEVTVVRKDT